MLTQIGLLLTIATTLGVLARTLKLPTILGYILTGILVTQLLDISFITSIFPHSTTNFTEFLEVLSSLGIALLLFMLGVELDFNEIRHVGPVSLITGLGQIIITSIVGFLIAFGVFKFSVIASAYIAIALTFSSTIIIVKLLTEKGDINSLYGRISIGLLLVQDLVAILALILLTSFQSPAQTNPATLSLVVGSTLIKGILFLALALLLTRIFTPWIFKHLTQSTELILIGSISWAVLFSLFAESIGFTLEIGAFMAGLTLAASPFNVEISAKIKPLRDFFIILFFIFLGMSLSPQDIGALMVPATILALFVLIGNPLILLSILGLMGYHRRVSFLTGLTVAQISEFSLIVAALGNKLGHLDDAAVSLITIVGIVTITLSSYLIQQGDKIYQRIEPLLKFFERKKLHSSHAHQLKSQDIKDHVIIFGFGRMGKEFLRELENLGLYAIIIDYDPSVVHETKTEKNSQEKETYQLLYGDASDIELLKSIQVESAKLVITTIPNFEANAFIVEESCQLNPGIVIICRAASEEEAKELKRLGANFVVVPEVVAAHAVSGILEAADLH